MHGERVCVLKVVRQQNGPCHDDQLKIKHIGSSFRIGSTGECRSWEREDSRKEEKWKILLRVFFFFFKEKGKKKKRFFLHRAKMMDASVMCKMNQVCMER